jgi:predicted type IV restriction endonuclease
MLEKIFIQSSVLAWSEIRIWIRIRIRIELKCWIRVHIRIRLKSIRIHNPALMLNNLRTSNEIAISKGQEHKLFYVKALTSLKITNIYQ